MNKNILTPKRAEEIQNEIFRKMSGEEKLKLALKINDRIFKTAKKKTKSQYPNLDFLPFYNKFYEYLSLKREYYENLFNQFLEKELKKLAAHQSTVEILEKILKNNQI